jgi:hypothetical protein
MGKRIWEQEVEEEYGGERETGKVKRERDDWGRVETSNRNRRRLGQSLREGSGEMGIGNWPSISALSWQTTKNSTQVCLAGNKSLNKSIF